MVTIPHAHPEINPGRGQRASARRETDPYQLRNPERSRWERSVKATKGLKGSRRLVLESIVDRCGGKPSCFPRDRVIVDDTELGLSTVSEALADLVVKGVIRIVRRKGSIRRLIVVMSHPHAEAFLSDPSLHAWKSRKTSPDEGDSIPRIQEFNSQILGIQFPESGDSIPRIQEFKEPLREPQRGNSNDKRGSSVVGRDLPSFPEYPQESNRKQACEPPANARGDADGIFAGLMEEVGKFYTSPASLINEVQGQHPGVSLGLVLDAAKVTNAARNAGEIKKTVLGFFRSVVARKLEDAKVAPPSSPDQPIKYHVAPADSPYREIERQDRARLFAIFGGGPHAPAPTPAQSFLKEIKGEGFRITITESGELAWKTPKPPGDSSWARKFGERIDCRHRELIDRLAPLEAEVRELLLAEAREPAMV